MVIDIAKILEEKKQKSLQESMTKVEAFLKNINRIVKQDLYTKSLPRLLFDIEYIDSGNLATYKVVYEDFPCSILTEAGVLLTDKQNKGLVVIPKIGKNYKVSWSLTASEQEIRKELHALVTSIVDYEDASFFSLLDSNFSFGRGLAFDSTKLTSKVIFEVENYFSHKHFKLGCIVLSKNCYDSMVPGIHTDSGISISILGNSVIRITNEKGEERNLQVVLTNKIEDNTLYFLDPVAARHNLVMPVYNDFYLTYFPEMEDKFSAQGVSSIGMGIIDMSPSMKVTLTKG